MKVASSQRGGRGFWLTVTSGIAVLALVAFAAGWFLRPGRGPDSLTPREATSVPVAMEDYTDALNVQVSFRAADPMVVAVNTSGVLRETRCVPGQPVQANSVLATVNLQPVIAFHTPEPLFRDLATGDKGSDVGQLNAELERLGYGTGLSRASTFGAKTMTAVRSFHKAHGIAPSSGAFALADIAWIPREAVTPSQCPVTVGSAVGPGQSLAELPGSLEAIIVQPLPARAIAGPRTMALLEAEIHFEPIPGVPLEIVDPAALEAARNARSFPDALALGESFPAKASLQTPIRVGRIPAGALFAATGVSGCVQSGKSVVPVTIVGSRSGTALVQGENLPTTVNIGKAVTATSCQ